MSNILQSIGAGANQLLGSSTPSDVNTLGLPIMLTVTMLLIVGISYRIFIDAFMSAKNELVTFLCFICAFVNMILSIFLFFSAAFGYAVVSCFLAFLLACVCSNNSLHTHKSQLFFVYVFWFMIMVGFPTAWSAGLINLTTADLCSAFYSGSNRSLCAQGWLTFLRIVAIVVVTFTIVSLLMLVAMMVNLTNPISVTAKRTVVTTHRTSHTQASNSRST